MSINIIKEEIKIILETLNEQYSIIDEHKKKIPQIEIDIVLANIRKLYELFYDLNKLNTLNKNSIDANIAVNFVNEKQEISIKEEIISTPIETEIEKPQKNNNDELNIVEVEIQEKPAVEPEQPVEELETLSETPELIMPLEEAEPESEPDKSILEIPIEDVNESLEDVKEDLLKEPIPEIPKTIKPRKKQAMDLFSFAEKETVADKFKETPKLMHDKISHDNSEKTLASKVGKSSITNLKNAIGINDKFLFINELFKGDLQEYNKSIDILNSVVGIEEANVFIEDLKEKFNWNEKQEVLQKLEDLIIRKFL